MGQIEKGEKILRKAMALQNGDGRIVLLNITENLPGYLAIEVPADFIDKNVADATQRLNELNAACNAGAEVVVRVGAPADQILLLADEIGADLIMVASHRPNFSNYLLGATADRVVRHAKCSVLVDR